MAVNDFSNPYFIQCILKKTDAQDVSVQELSPEFWKCHVSICNIS